ETATLTFNVSSENAIEDIVVALDSENEFFSIDKDAITESGDVTLTFAPTAVGQFTATLKLTTDMAEEKTVSINATANPQTPVATEATNISGVSFTANWEATENASSYILTILSNNYENVITVDGNETSHNVTNLISSTVYTYTVKVVVNELTSDYSNTITVTTTGGAAISYKEFNTSFIATRGSNDSKTVEVTAAELTENIQATVSGSDFFSIENNTLTAEGGTFDIVFAPTAVGTYSSEITLKSGETTITINISGTANTEAPVATEATDLQPTSFVANWEAVAGATYTLYVNDEVKYEGNETSALVEGLIPNVQYNYYVTATVNSFVSEKSNTISVNSLETPVISISGENNLNAVNNEQESVTLNIVGENIVSKIDVTLADESGFFSIDKTELQESGELTLTFAPNIIGKYEGSIIISSEFAESKTFKFTGICKPAAPTATEASDIRGTTFVANWNGIETDNATYYVEVKKDDVIAYGEYTKDTNIKVNGLEAETAYTYTVNAIINDIWSAPSNEISVSTSKPVIAYTDFEKSFNLQINDWENKTVNLTPSALDHHIDVTIEGSEYFGLNDVITSKDGGSFNITFLPRATGVFNAQVTLVSEGAEDVVINITGTATPRKTSAFGVNDVTNSSCIAYWSASEGATNYILKVNGNEVYRGNETSFEVTNLAANTNYTLELIAIDDNNLESEPATATVTTVNAPAIADITAIPAFNTIVNKTQNQTVTVAGENLLGAIYVTIEGDEAFIISNGQINANEELIIGLTSDTPGNYEATLTFNSRNAETKTLNVSGTVRPKTASSKAATEVSSNSFRANWVKSSANATYTVIVKNGNNIVATKEVEAGNTSVVIDGLNAATAYTYTIIATENGIDADTSEVISVTTDEEAVASITFNASVSAEKTTATVKWIVISDTDVTPTSVKVTCNGNTQTLSGNATSCTITGLNKSSGYSATVTALIDGKEYTKTVSFATKGDYYGQQLPNPEFELWETSTEETAEPIGWNSFMTAKTNFLTQFGKHKAMNKSSNVKRPGTNGSTSVYIWTADISNVHANGNMTTGKVNMGAASATSAKNYNFTDRSSSAHSASFTSVPDSLTVWVKFESGNTSNGPAGVSALIHGDTDFQDPVTDNSQLVASAISNISQYSTAWVRLSVPFTKVNSGVSPKYILCSFKTNNSAGVGTDGEKLYVDDALMIYKPTLTVNNLNNTQYQAGDAITLNFSITGTMSPYNLNAAANVAYLELSDANGSFSSPIVLDQITTDFGGTFMGKLPFNIANGNYKIRVRTTNYPMTSGTQNITVSTPVVELGDIEATEASDITSSSFVANWNAAENAEGYYLTVEDGEGEIVGDYDKKDMGNKLYEEVVIDTKGTASMYSYIVTAYRGSEEKKSEWINVTLSSTTGIDDADAEQFDLIVYPNPAIDVIHITNAEKVAEALVYDINGALRIAQNNGNDINVSTMAQGTYILKVKTTNGKMYHTIFIKEK
ncbi:MAG: T9SS type A sorting domain-containing protein, partial [Paludibacteraceae bacterium]|nr:T9SS type A sorting domain-containing protein [Paludibacteraceae bacterium]